MDHKASLSLSIEIIVVVIISVVILSAGIVILYKFIGGAEELKTTLDERTDAELERLLVDESKQVALPLHLATVYRGDSHVFGLGILNIGSVGELFRIEITLNEAFDEAENKLTVDEEAIVNKWLLYETRELTIKEHEHRKEAILVKVPTDALKGTYIFNAQVKDSVRQPYGNVQKFYVTVK